METVVGALLPIVVTLLLGYFAGWHHDFGADQAAVLNRMVMLYALPLSLFTGILSTNRSALTSDVGVVVAIAAAMIVLARNLLVPAALWGVLVALGATSHVVRESVVTLAIPTASIAVILAVQYKTDEREMASSLLFSTLLSVVTMSAFILLT